MTHLMIIWYRTEKKIDKPSRLVLTPLIDLLINNNNMHERVNVTISCDDYLFFTLRLNDSIINEIQSIYNIMVYLQRGRSNSDGTVVPLNQNADAFPSLPNSVLEKLGLYGCNNSRFDFLKMFCIYEGKGMKNSLFFWFSPLGFSARPS